jgi:hypothetical protein
MKIELTVCNVCSDPARATKSYRVSNGGRSTVVDLCEEHGAQLEAWLGEPAPVRVPAKAQPVKSSRRRTPHMTMAEIEQAKASQRA